MIQVYSPGNTDFDHNGDAALMPESCYLRAVLNSEWRLEMVHPVDDRGLWALVVENAVLKVPTWQDREQLYRIRSVSKTEDNVSAVAYPIFFDSANDLFLLDTRPTGKNGQAALDIMTAGNGKYTAHSDISKTETAYFVKRNFMDCLQGQESPTFLERWGGEIVYDNFDLYVNQRAGGDYGATVRYGKNILGVEYKVDMSEVVTRIIPQAYNGHLLSYAEPWIDSEHIGSFPTVRTKVVTFEDIKLASDAGDDDDGIICADQEALDAALVHAAEQAYEDGLDKPAVTIDIDMFALAKTEEYKDFADLEDIRLGDTVHCIHERLGIDTKAKAIEIEWDCILDQISTIKIGAYEYDYLAELSDVAGRISGAIRPDGSLIAERISGFIDAATTQMRAQYNAAERQDVLAMLFENLDESSPLYGAVAVGTQGIQISKTRTQDGRSWVWQSAMTSGGLIADTALVGVIADKAGLNYWNLETGEFRLSASASMALTHEEVFNALTKNGELDAIYMGQDGKMYISFSYAAGGQLKLGGRNNEHGEILIYDANGNVIGSINKDSCEFSSKTGVTYIDLANNTTYQNVIESIIFDGATIKGRVRGNSSRGQVDEILSWISLAMGVLTLHNEANGVRIDAGDLYLVKNYDPNAGLFDTDKNLPINIHGRIYFKDYIYFDAQTNFNNYVNLNRTDTISNGTELVVSSGGRVGRTSSSERYKIISRDMTSEDVERAYKIRPVLARYKEDVLSQGDESKNIPMLIAEDVAYNLPDAAVYWDGQVEDWNPRVMIPVMLRMIQDQNERIKTLEALWQTLK